MVVSDVTKDSLLGPNEYILWLNRVTAGSGAAQYTSYAALPPALQALYTDHALAANGFIDIAGAKTGTPTTSPGQGANLDNMCNAGTLLLIWIVSVCVLYMPLCLRTDECVWGEQRMCSQFWRKKYICTCSFTFNVPKSWIRLNLSSLIIVAASAFAAASTGATPATPAATAATPQLTASSTESIRQIGGGAATAAAAATMGPTTNPQLCYLSLYAADTDRNNILTQPEYIAFVNRMAANKYIAVTTFAGLPQAIQDNYNTLLASTGGVGGLPITGASPTQPADAAQQAILNQICTGTDTAIYTADSAPAAAVAGTATPGTAAGTATPGVAAAGTTTPVASMSPGTAAPGSAGTTNPMASMSPATAAPGAVGTTNPVASISPGTATPGSAGTAMPGASTSPATAAPGMGTGVPGATMATTVPAGNASSPLATAAPSIPRTDVASCKLSMVREFLTSREPWTFITTRFVVIMFQF